MLTARPRKTSSAWPASSAFATHAPPVRTTYWKSALVIFSEWCKMSSRENPKTRTSRRNSTAHPGKTVASVGCIVTVYHSRFFIKSENNKKLTAKAGTPFRECFGRFMPRSTCNCPSSYSRLRCNPQQLCKSGMHAPLQLCRLPRHCCRC